MNNDNLCSESFNLKQFVNDHKKEIFISSISIFSTVLFYRYYRIKINKDSFNLTFANDYDYSKASFGNINICLKGCKVKDLGKFGQKMIEYFPAILSKNDTIDNVHFVFNVLSDFKE